MMGCLLKEIIKGRMNCKPTRGRRRLQMLYDLTTVDLGIPNPGVFL